MPFTPEALQEARNQGYSDPDIYSHLAQTDPRFADAQKEGYALDEVAQHFAASPSLASGAGSLALSQAGKGAKAALFSLPGVNTASTFSNPNATGIDKASALAGDIGGAALLATPGGIIRKLGLGAGISAGLEASGINQGANALANKVQNIYSPTGQSVAGNFIKQIPQTLAATVIQSLPALIAGKFVAKSGALEGEPGETPPATALLEQQGGTPPPSASISNPVGKVAAQGFERLAKTNPLIDASIIKPMEAQNAQAIKGYVTKQAPGSLEPNGASGGKTIMDIVNRANEANQINYKDILDKIPQGKYPEQMGNPGKQAASKMLDLLNTQGYMNDDVVGLIQDTAKNIARQGNTPQGYDNAIKQFNDEKLDLLNDNPLRAGSINHFTGAVNNILKNTHYDALNHLNPDGSYNPTNSGLGDILKGTNFDYAQSKNQFFGPLAEMTGGKIEDLPRKMLTAGTKFQDVAKKQLGTDIYSDLQNEGLNELMRQAQDAKGNLNAQKLENLYHKYNAMDWRPDQKSAIENTIGMMHAAGLNSLAEENPSGTATNAAKMAHVGALFQPHLWGPLTAETAAQGLYFKLPQAYRAIQNTPIAQSLAAQRGGVSPALQQAAFGAYLARPNSQGGQ